jgi:hypothetical protein
VKVTKKPSSLKEKLIAASEFRQQKSLVQAKRYQLLKIFFPGTYLYLITATN